MRLALLLFPVAAFGDVLGLTGDGIAIGYAKLEIPQEKPLVPKLAFRIANRTGEAWTRLIITATAEVDCDVRAISIWLHLSDVSAKRDPFVFSGLGSELKEHPGPCPIRAVSFALISAEKPGRVLGLYSDVKDSAERNEKLEAYEKQMQAAQAEGIENALKHAASMREMEKEARAREALLRKACLSLYKATANRRIADLTVAQDQAIKACQRADMYPPLN